MAKTKKTDKAREIPKGLQRALAERKALTDSEALVLDLSDAWVGTRRLVPSHQGMPSRRREAAFFDLEVRICVQIPSFK